METAKLTIRLPKADLDFAKQYARTHGLTVTQLIDRFLRQLQVPADTPIHPEVKRITGLIATEVDALAEYHRYLEDKHSK
jgi:hypothetical protein